MSRGLGGRSEKLIEMARGVNAPIPAETNRVSGLIVDGAIAVHKQLGPGLLESVYETCLAYELRQRELHVER